MANQASFRGRAQQDFVRLHRAFVEHFTYAVILAWAAALASAWFAPWVHNIRALIDPLGRQESTASYIFSLPVVMTLALFVVASSPDLLRRSALVKSHAVEFAFGGAVAFGVFCLSVQRAVTAYLLGG